jgi:hypothetical protein
MKLLKNLVLATTLVTGSLLNILPANAGVLGGIDIDRHCREIHGSGSYATLIERTAWGWRCQSGSNQYSIDLTNACKRQYNNQNARAETTNSRDPYSWRCVTGITTLIR